MVAVTGPAFLEGTFEGVESAAVFDETGNIDLGADEVSDGATVVVERGDHDEVHKGGTVSSAS